jgi:regulator of protease activity HflC (stomatin/prohibitin superfamily)
MFKVFTNEDEDILWGKVVKAALTAFVLIVIICICWPMKIIGPTERGVVKTFGEVNKERLLEPGLAFKIPFVQKIATYDLTPSTIRINIPLGENAAISSDKQTIGVKGTVDWKYDESKIIDIATRYSSTRDLAIQTENIIITAIKNTIGQHRIDDIAKDQDAIANQAKLISAARLLNAGIPVILTTVNLNNWDWTEDYDAMIKQTVAMQQATQRAAAELAMIEQTAQKQIKEAEAKANADAAAADGRRRAAELDAEAMRAKAQGEADAKRIEGEGIASYNRSIATTLDTQRALRQLDIAMKEAESWDGRRVPTYIPLNPTGGLVTLPAPSR